MNAKYQPAALRPRGKLTEYIYIFFEIVCDLSGCTTFLFLLPLFLEKEFKQIHLRSNQEK